MERSQTFRTLCALTLAAGLVAPALAVTVPRSDKHQTLIYRHDGIRFDVAQAAGTEVGEALGGERFAALGVDPATSFVDLRTGRFTGLQPALPLLPGRGVGNSMTWDDLDRPQPRNDQQLREAAAAAYTAFLARHAEALRIDLSELASPGRITVVDPDYIVISTPHVVDGLPVLGSSLIATIRYGNLVLWGAIQWGDVDRSLSATVSEPAAREVVARHVAPFELGATWKGSSLAWLPFSTESSFSDANAGNALEHRLVWVVRPTLGVDGDHWEALVDARTGELLSFQDLHQYVATQRRVQGGVYPVANDGLSPGGIPDGVEQAGYPMSFSTVTVPGGGSVTTDVGGNLPTCIDGTISSALSGTFMRMNDTCGSPLTSSASNLDFGVSGGTDCTVPAGTGPGNTHASRSGFFEMNQIKMVGRAELPANTWLTEQLTANMNVVATCNANWNGSQVNFFRSGGGCRNTGEIAGIFDHEWGHGMDDNDANGSILAIGSEGIADIYASLRTDDSCIGRGFRVSGGCGGYGNPCIDPPGDAPLCTGVRDIDYANRQDNIPWTPTTPDILACGGEVHCVGYINAESIWDLWNRHLTAGVFNFSRDLSRIIANQQTHRAAGAVNNWWSGTGGTAGCGADSGYLQYLAADDDDGNIGNGTPHMTAIDAAFQTHGIDCTATTVTNSGCAGRPTVAPVVTPTARDKGVDLAWAAVPNAATYRIYRTDGVHGCSFGKTLVAETASLSYADRGLQNGRNYYYQVVPMGTADECFGTAASSCVTGTPSAAGGGTVFTAIEEQLDLTILSGDGDPFLDNCEQGRVRLPLANAGTAALTNVRILTATSPSHGATTFVTSFPKIVDASLVSCETAVATLEFIPGGDVSPGDTITIDIDVMADELSAPVTVNFAFDLTEGDFQNQASKTFNFEASTEGWQTTAGTFNRTNVAPGGAGGAGTFYYQSSAFLDEQCDVVQSPLIRLTSTSTMSLFTHFRTEQNDGQWWDRANIGVLDANSGVRTRVDPSGGRLYNASGANGVCGTDGQPGWAGLSPSWASSSWSSAALQAGTLAGKAARLEVRYGTDPLVNDDGFRFDEVTLTNFDLQVSDAQSDTCGASSYVFADDFETGNTQEWSQTSP